MNSPRILSMFTFCVWSWFIFLQSLAAKAELLYTAILTMQDTFLRQVYITFLSTIQELASVHALRRNEKLFAGLEFVWISKVDDSQRRTTARVVNDVLTKIFHHITPIN